MGVGRGVRHFEMGWRSAALARDLQGESAYVSAHITSAGWASDRRRTSELQRWWRAEQAQENCTFAKSARQQRSRNGGAAKAHAVRFVESAELRAGGVLSRLNRVKRWLRRRRRRGARLAVARPCLIAVVTTQAVNTR